MMGFRVHYALIDIVILGPLSRFVSLRKVLLCSGVRPLHREMRCNLLPRCRVHASVERSEVNAPEGAVRSGCSTESRAYGTGAILSFIVVERVPFFFFFFFRKGAKKSSESFCRKLGNGIACQPRASVVVVAAES